MVGACAGNRIPESQRHRFRDRFFEKSRTGRGAYPLAVGRTVELTERRINGAIKMHIRGTQESGLRVQRPPVFHHLQPTPIRQRVADKR